MDDVEPLSWIQKVSDVIPQQGRERRTRQLFQAPKVDEIIKRNFVNGIIFLTCDK